MDISFATEILPVILYSLLSKKINDKRLRVVLFTLVFSFVFDIYALYAIVTKGNNYILYNINVLIEATALYTYFYWLIANKFAKKLILSCIIFFIAFWIYEFSTSGKSRFLDNCTVFENISILTIIIFYYYEKIIVTNDFYVYSQTNFWVVTAYFIFIAGTFFLLLYIPSLEVTEQQKYYILSYIFAIIRNILLSIAMFMKNKNSSKQQYTLT